MKNRLLVLFILLSASLSAQCTSDFSYTFDAATDKLTCWANDTAGAGYWMRDDYYQFIDSDNISTFWQEDTLTLVVPYGNHVFNISHYKCDISTHNTITINNTDGDACDANFVVQIEPAAFEYLFTGTTDNGISHVWTLDNDTISTLSTCEFVSNTNFILNHTVYNSSGCNSSQVFLKTLASVNTINHTFTIGNPFPNPTNGNVTLSIDATQSNVLSITIYNLLGQPVLSQSNTISTGNQTIQLPTEGLAQGVYILQIADKKGSGVITQKLIKN